MTENREKVEKQRAKVVKLHKKVKPKYSITEDEQRAFDDEERAFDKQLFDKSDDINDDQEDEKNPPIYKRASDKRGHSILFALRLPPWMVSAMGSIVENKSSPFKKTSEFARDAIHKHLDYYAKRLGHTKDAVNIQKRMLSEWIDIQSDLKTEFDSDIKNFRGMVSKLTGDELDDFIEEFKRHVDRLGDGYRKKQYYAGAKKALQDSDIEPRHYGFDQTPTNSK